MTYAIEFDEASLERTARVLEVINPGRSDANHMRDIVRANMWKGHTSMGTAGWEACGFFPDHKPGVMVVRFAVAAFVVEQYLEAQQCP